MTVLAMPRPISRSQTWSAVGSMALCVAMLIAAEFMPVSLLTPIAADLGATPGQAGQAISVSGLFAVLTSLVIPAIARRLERRRLLTGLTALLLLSLIVIAEAPNFTLLMLARALLGMVIGGIWALATATVMRLVPQESVPKALAAVYIGNAVATAFAAPIGSYLGGIMGWRAVFWALTPIVAVNLIWQWRSLPEMPPETAPPRGNPFNMLKRSHVRRAMLATMLTFAGAFCIFTYLRPLLESSLRVNASQLSLLLLGLGLAGFGGTLGSGAVLKTHLYPLLRWLPLALATVTVILLGLRNNLWEVALALIAWGGLNSAIPVAWSTWLSQGVSDDPESGGGLMVAAIQFAIMLGASVGGALLDHISIGAPFVGGVMLLAVATATIGDGAGIRPRVGWAERELP